MKPLNNSKKANMVGFAIIGLALLLLLGSITTNSDSSIYDDNNDNSNSQNGNSGIGDYNIINEKLFEINSTILGKEEVEIQNFPNIKIGSAVEYKELAKVTDIVLKQSSFTSNEFLFELNRDIVDDEDFLGLLIVVQSPKTTFDSSIGLLINNKLYSSYNKNSQFPIRVDKNQFQNNSNNEIILRTPSVDWFQIFSGSEQNLNEIKIIGIYQDSRYSQRNIDFLVNSEDEDNLNFLRMKLSVICPRGEDGSSVIEAFVNNFKVLSQNPSCLSNTAGSTVLSAQIPTDVLNLEETGKNTITLNTQGKYDTSLQIEEVYFNDDYEYSFYINRGEDIEDVIIFGDFDKESLDIQINSHRFTINRRETQSIRTKLRSGRNELVIHDIPVEIEQLLIEEIIRDE